MPSLRSNGPVLETDSLHCRGMHREVACAWMARHANHAVIASAKCKHKEPLAATYLTPPFQMKYSLLDERDISLVHEYTFEARTEVDRNGCGASIFAFAFRFDAEKGKVGKYVQDVLWERHRGSIAPGHRVVHKNGISVDNRLENLILVPVSVAQSWTLQHQLQQQRHLDREQRQREHAELDGSVRRRDDNAKLDGEGAAASPSSPSSSSSTKHHPAGPEMAESPEQSLYWIAIQQLPQESMEEVSA